MSGFGYSTGQSWGIVAGGAAVMLSAETAPATARSVLDALRAGAPAGRVLGLLASAAGGDLLALPDFALLVVEPTRTRLVLRGFPGSIDERPVAGADVLTWTEHEATPGATVRIGEPLQDDGLEIADGIVRCGGIALGVTSARAPTSPPAVAARGTQPAADPPSPHETLDPGATLMPSTGPVRADAPPADPAPIAGAPLAAGPSAPVTRVLGTHPDPVDVGDADLTGLTDLLGGGTVVRSIADAARWPDRERAAREPLPRSDPDHDGMTMRRSDMEQPLTAVDRRIVGSVRLGDGRFWAVDRPIVIGRRPQASRVTASEVPHLITVDSPTQDISRSHVEIRPEGMHAVVSDLGTTNGTMLHRAGRLVQRLEAGDRHVLADGDVLDLGDDVLVTFAAGGIE